MPELLCFFSSTNYLQAGFGLTAPPTICSGVLVVVFLEETYKFKPYYASITLVMGKMLSAYSPLFLCLY